MQGFYSSIMKVPAIVRGLQNKKYYLLKPSNKSLALFDSIKLLGDKYNVNLKHIKIVKTTEINAESNLNNQTLALTTGDLQELNHSELRALIGHEIYHFHNKHHYETLGYLSRLFGIISLICLGINLWMFILLGTYNQPLMLTTFLAPILGIIFLIMFCHYQQVQEYRADDFSAKISSKSAILDILNDYPTPQSKTIRIINILFGQHPTSQQRINNLKHNPQLQRIAFE